MRYLVMTIMACLLCASAQAQDAKSAEAFVRSVYALDVSNNFDMYDRDADAVFAPPLIALMNQDADMERADVPVWAEGDPFCDCQDNEGLVLNSVAVQSAEKGAAHAVAVYSFKNYQVQKQIRLELIAVKGQWRISDISNDHMPSLRQEIKKSIDDYNQNKQ